MEDVIDAVALHVTRPSNGVDGDGAAAVGATFATALRGLVPWVAALEPDAEGLRIPLRQTACVRVACDVVFWTAVLPSLRRAGVVPALSVRPEDRHLAAFSRDATRRLERDAPPPNDAAALGLIDAALAVLAAPRFHTLKRRYYPDAAALLLLAARGGALDDDARGAQARPSTAPPITSGAHPRDAAARALLRSGASVPGAVDALLAVLTPPGAQPQPAWLRATAGRALSSILLLPDAAAVVVDFMLGDVAETYTGAFTRVAALLCKPPKQICTVGEYFGVVLPQVARMLQVGNSGGGSSEARRRVALLCCAKLARTCAAACRKLLLEPLLPALLQQRPGPGRSGGSTPAAIVRCAVQIDALLATAATTAAPALLALLCPAIVVLLRAHVAAREALHQSISTSSRGLVVEVDVAAAADAAALPLREECTALLNASRKTLASFFASTSSDATLVVRCLDKLSAASALRVVNRDSDGDSDGAGFVLTDNDDEAAQQESGDSSEHLARECEAVVGVLFVADQAKRALLGGVFVEVLQQYVSQRLDSTTAEDDDNAGQTAMQRRQPPPLRCWANFCPRILLVLLVKVGPKALSSTSQCLECIEASLVMCANALDGELVDVHDPSLAERLSSTVEVLALCANVLLGVCQASALVGDKESKGMRKLLPVLERLTALAPVISLLPSGGEAAAAIAAARIAIVTSAWKTGDAAAPPTPPTPAAAAAAATSGAVVVTSARVAPPAAPLNVMAAVSAAASDLKSSLPHERAHGISLLEKLLQDARFTSEAEVDMVIQVVLACLQDTDSFVYLRAIRALRIAMDAHATKVLPHLARHFVDRQATLPHDSRIKLGEALGGACRRCGETLPQWAPHIVRCLLATLAATGSSSSSSSRGSSSGGALSEEARICELRTSCLSLLADVVSTVGARAMPQLPRVAACARAALQHRGGGRGAAAKERGLTPAYQATTRRAAAYLIAALLETCDAGDVHELEGTLREMRAPIAFAAQSDRDPPTRIHARRALAHLDSLTKAFFFPNTM